MTTRQSARAAGDHSARSRRNPLMTGCIAMFGVLIIVSFALGQTLTSTPGTSASASPISGFPSPDSGLSKLTASHGVEFVPLSAAQLKALGPQPTATLVAQKASALMKLAYGPSAIYIGLVSSVPGASPEASGGLAPTPAYAILFVSAKADIPVGTQAYSQVLLFLSVAKASPIVEIGLA